MHDTILTHGTASFYDQGLGLARGPGSVRHRRNAQLRRGPHAAGLCHAVILSESTLDS